jgi:hypothetical protein
MSDLQPMTALRFERAFELDNAPDEALDAALDNAALDNGEDIDADIRTPMHERRAGALRA